MRRIPVLLAPRSGARAGSYFSCQILVADSDDFSESGSPIVESFGLRLVTCPPGAEDQLFELEFGEIRLQWGKGSSPDASHQPPIP